MFLRLFSLVFFLTGCSVPIAPMMSNVSPKDTENKVMLVLTQPVTPGFVRLNYYASVHPDFRQLLDRLGLPDFVAETRQEDHRYVLLYYLQQKKTFALRDSLKNKRKPMEMSGPYPITPKEYAMLTSFKKKALQSF